MTTELGDAFASTHKSVGNAQIKKSLNLRDIDLTQNGGLGLLFAALVFGWDDLKTWLNDVAELSERHGDLSPEEDSRLEYLLEKKDLESVDQFVDEYGGEPPLPVEDFDQDQFAGHMKRAGVLKELVVPHKTATPIKEKIPEHKTSNAFKEVVDISESEQPGEMSLASIQDPQEGLVLYPPTSGKWTLSVQKTGEVTSPGGHDMAVGKLVLVSPEGEIQSFDFRSGGWGKYGDNSMLPGLGRNSMESVSYGLDYNSYIHDGRDLPKGMLGSDGRGSWLRIENDSYMDGRSSFGIHTDGNVPGSLGCIVMDENVTKQLFDVLDEIPPGQRPEQLHVLPPQEVVQNHLLFAAAPSAISNALGET